MRKWKELLETQLPDNVYLPNIVSFCTTTRSLFIRSGIQLSKEVEFYEDGKGERKYKTVTVKQRNRKYYRYVKPDSNISQASGGHTKIAGMTTWKFIRIIQGPTSPLIDITDFTYANRKGWKNWMFYGTTLSGIPL